jgi:hypothetical protein
MEKSTATFIFGEIFFMKLPFFFLLALTFSCDSPKADSPKVQNSVPEEISPEAIVQEVSAELFMHLTEAFKSGSVASAVEYCSHNAQQIIKEKSNSYKNVIISRLTEKFRNPANRPRGEEAKILEKYDLANKSGYELEARTHEENGQIVHYSPIIIKSDLCLKCHGVIGETMTSEDHDDIKKFYQFDKAYGYRMGDFRGMWKVVIN